MGDDQTGHERKYGRNRHEVEGDFDSNGEECSRLCDVVGPCPQHVLLDQLKPKIKKLPPQK